MSYNITLSNGATLLNLTDGSIDSKITSLNLVGRGSTNYGTSIADNFVHLLENFANTSAPISPLSGQLWYDSSTSYLRLYDGAHWTAIQSSSDIVGYSLKAGAGVPASTIGSTGDYYVDTTNGILYGPKGTNWASTNTAFATHPEGTGTAVGVLFMGQGTPNSTLGTDGDWYGDKLTGALYGPKGTPTAGVWTINGSFGVNCSAGVTYPPNAKLGDMFFDNNLGVLYIFMSDGASKFWIDISSSGGAGGGGNITTGTVAPATPSLGDMFYNTTNSHFYLYLNNGTSNIWFDLTPTVTSVGNGLTLSNGVVSSSLGTGTRPVLS